MVIWILVNRRCGVIVCWVTLWIWMNGWIGWVPPCHFGWPTFTLPYCALARCFAADLLFLPIFTPFHTYAPFIAGHRRKAAILCVSSSLPGRGRAARLPRTFAARGRFVARCVAWGRSSIASFDAATTAVQPLWAAFFTIATYLATFAARARAGVCA